MTAASDQPCVHTLHMYSQYTQSYDEWTASADTQNEKPILRLSISKRLSAYPRNMAGGYVFPY